LGPAAVIFTIPHAKVKYNTLAQKVVHFLNKNRDPGSGVFVVSLWGRRSSFGIGIIGFFFGQGHDEPPLPV
jgi:hypothetical protein